MMTDHKMKDCLTLSLWVPERNDYNETTLKPKLPVMVWIYGGGFTYGMTHSIFYGNCDNDVAQQRPNESRYSLVDGQSLVKSSENSIIFVSFNYR